MARPRLTGSSSTARGRAGVRASAAGAASRERVARLFPSPPKDLYCCFLLVASCSEREREKWRKKEEEEKREGRKRKERKKRENVLCSAIKLREEREPCRRREGSFHFPSQIGTPLSPALLVAGGGEFSKAREGERTRYQYSAKKQNEMKETRHSSRKKRGQTKMKSKKGRSSTLSVSRPLTHRGGEKKETKERTNKEPEKGSRKVEKRGGSEVCSFPLLKTSFSSSSSPSRHLHSILSISASSWGGAGWCGHTSSCGSWWREGGGGRST